MFPTVLFFLAAIAQLSVGLPLFNGRIGAALQALRPNRPSILAPIPVARPGAGVTVPSYNPTAPNPAAPNPAAPAGKNYAHGLNSVIPLVNGFSGILCKAAEDTSTGKVFCRYVDPGSPIDNRLECIYTQGAFSAERLTKNGIKKEQPQNFCSPKGPTLEDVVPR